MTESEMKNLMTKNEQEQTAILRTKTEAEVRDYLAFVTSGAYLTPDPEPVVTTPVPVKNPKNPHMSTEELVEHRQILIDQGRKAVNSTSIFSHARRKAAYNNLLAGLLAEANNLTAQLYKFPETSDKYQAALKSLKEISDLIIRLKSEKNRNLAIKLGSFGPIAGMLLMWAIERYGGTFIDKNMIGMINKIPGADKFLKN